jgi:hypothetical protein
MSVSDEERDFDVFAIVVIVVGLVGLVPPVLALNRIVHRRRQKRRVALSAGTSPPAGTSP